MLQLKCTQKLIQFSDVRPAPFPEQPIETMLGGWHANIVDFVRPPLLIFLNDRSLYCLIDIARLYGERMDLAMIFRENLLRALQENQVSEGQMNRVFEDYNEAIVTRTDNRKVLGNLTDIMNLIYFNIEDAVERNERIDLRNLEHKLNSMPQRNINWKFSSDIFKQILGAS